MFGQGKFRWAGRATLMAKTKIVYGISVRKFQKNARLVCRRSVRCWEYNIKVDDINLTHDKIKLWAVLNMITF